MTTQWGWHEALSHNLGSPLIHFFFLLVKKEMNSSVLTAAKPVIANNSTADLHVTEMAFSENLGWRMGKKPSSQQNTIKRFISLERLILGWDMISAGFGLSQTISLREDSVTVSTT